MTVNCPYAWCSPSVLPQCVGHKPSEPKENTRSFSYRGRHDDPGPAKERINARGGATGRAATPPHCGPNPTPWLHFRFPRSPPRPRLRPAYGTHHRIIAQPGHSACSGCKRSPVRIRPVRPIFEPFDLGYCESSRSPTRRPAVRSPLAHFIACSANGKLGGLGAPGWKFDSSTRDHLGEASLLLPLSSRTSSVIQPPTRMKNAGRCAQAWRSGQPVHRQYPDGKSLLEFPKPSPGPFLVLLA